MRFLFRVVLSLAVTVCLLRALCGCAAIGAAIGGAGGALVAGPIGAVAGGTGGAEIGDVFAGRKRADERAAVAEAQLERERKTTSDLRATLLANKQIADHNATLAPGETPTRMYGPPAPERTDPPKPFFSRTLSEIFGRGK